jgi:hypothetical protein
MLVVEIDSQPSGRKRRQTFQIVWTPKTVEKSMLEPLLTSVATLVYLRAPHREAGLGHDFLTTCPLSREFKQVGPCQGDLIGQIFA